MSSTALIVASGPDIVSTADLATIASSCSLVIAVDGGAAALVAAGVRPDVVVGDMDSLSAAALAKLEGVGVRAIVAPAEKDESDLELALDFAQTSGVAEITVTGVSGGRQDHWLAALGALARHAALCPRILAPHFSARVLSPNGCAHAELRGPTTFSLIALGGPAVVTCQGSRWELDRAVLDPLSALGLSNYAVDDACVRADIHEGACLLYIPDGLSG